MLACTLAGLLVLGQAPAPQPLPRTTTPPAQPAAPATSAPIKPASPATEPTPSEATLGVVIYPGSQFMASYPAGRNQRYYLFGSSASFADIVVYYRTLLKQKGELVFDIPATHEFDIGKFHEETMAFPPGVTVKDYQSGATEGYPNPKPGGQPAKFRTVIQIVPVTER